MDLPKDLLWTPSDAVGVNEFLNTELGRKWLGLLFNRKPKIDLSSTDKAALTGAFAAGYELFLTEVAASRTTVEHPQPELRAIDPVRD